MHEWEKAKKAIEASRNVGLAVRCPHCGIARWETTERYNPRVAPNGSMIRLINPWRKWNWSPFGDGRDPGIAETSLVTCADMTCMECGGLLAPSGQLTVEEAEEEPQKIDVMSLTDALALKMADEYEPYDKIAEKTGLSRKTLKQHILGLKKRRLQQRIKELDRLLKEGLSQSEASRRMKVSTSTVAKIKKEYLDGRLD